MAKLEKRPRSGRISRVITATLLWLVGLFVDGREKESWGFWYASSAVEDSGSAALGWGVVLTLVGLLLSLALSGMYFLGMNVVWLSPVAFVVFLLAICGTVIYGVVTLVADDGRVTLVADLSIIVLASVIEIVLLLVAPSGLAG